MGREDLDDTVKVAHHGKDGLGAWVMPKGRPADRARPRSAATEEEEEGAQRRAAALRCALLPPGLDWAMGE